METANGISVETLENQSKVRQKTSMTELQREKRKSEVLIAAQSIDNEVQNVKSLKRISIGSFDLLMDPELEFRVNVNSHNARKSWSSNSSSSGEEYDVVSRKGAEEDETIVSDAADDSFDVTGADYLQITSNSSVSHEAPESTRSSSSASPQTSVKRTLTGVGSLRRGGVSTSTRKLSSGSENGSDDGSGSSLTKQLLWVPADQHPSVKPENFLELVQDTLHNIQLDEKSDSSDTENGENNKENLDAFDRLPIDISRKRDSLVRRPSRLRKSYTEFEEYDQDYSLEAEIASEKELHSPLDQPAITPRSSGRSSRTVSLKDITEELNKISNNAGLTSSDAITLARTLSMAGSFTGSDVSADQEILKGSGRHRNDEEISSEHRREDDNEFASNMLMKHGVVIPARSSLRRSKFNTYRVRSSGSTSSLDDGSSAKHKSGSRSNPASGLASGSTELLPSEIKPDTYPSPSIKESVSAASSPNSVNDFQDIYDHYRQSSVDWEKELKKGLQSDDSVKVEQPSGDLENSKYTDSSKVEDRPQNSAESNVETEGTENTSLPTNSDVKERKSGWSWLNGMSNRDAILDKHTKISAKEEKSAGRGSSLDEDFEKTSTIVTTENERSASQRSNHSKNRHSPIIPANEIANETAKKRESEEGGAASIKTSRSSSSSDSTNLTRQMFEKKIASLFRRKGKKKLPDQGSSESRVAPRVSLKPSDDGISKFSKSSKTPLKLKSESRVEEHLRNSISKDVLSSNAATPDQNIQLESNIEDLPALQPAVSVTSTKSANGPQEYGLVESVKELDGDDSQDISMDRSASIDISRETLSMKEQTSEARAEQTTDASTQLAPPRKLTFEDVKRPERPNAPMKFTDSAFGFPLPMLTVSTVVMFDHRLPINVERAIYRLSHLKLSDPKRELRQQVVLSNFMYAYLNLVNHTLYMEQVAQENDLNAETSGAAFETEQNSADGSICIPDM